MTVIKRKPQHFNCPNSANTSDTESLHLGNSLPTSDTESLNNEPVVTNIRQRPCRIQQVEELVTLKKCCGRKKLRLYENRCTLQTLSEEDENEGGLVVIMEPSRAPLTRLFEDDSALNYWNEFIEKSEDEQMQFMEKFSEKVKRDMIHDKPEKIERTFKRIPSKIRHTIKVKKNLPIEYIKSCEEDIVSFFTETPNDVFIEICDTTFKKLLLFAIVLYHHLVFENVSSEGRHFVHISNPLTNSWVPADCNLSTFLSQLKR